jgi:hypothetical protein
MVALFVGGIATLLLSISMFMSGLAKGVLMRYLVCLFFLLCIALPRLQAQTIVVDRHSVALFDSIPSAYKEAARNLRLFFMNRSVGGNINDALSCLSWPYENAPNYCKRHQHRDSAYAVHPSEVYWDGAWDRSNWRYEFWPSGCDEDANCFINSVEARIDSFDVVGFQFSYLSVTPGSRLADPVDGFFGTRGNRATATTYREFAARHPGKTVIWWTTSLARAIGSPESELFNQLMRDYTRTHDLVLFDVADILSHDPAGNPCYDNRDGVPYLHENHPDDGLDIPAICPQYTTETEGGHLGSISAGGIRVAKAFWVLMARIAGWDGGAADTMRVPAAPSLLLPADNALLDEEDVRFSWGHSLPSVYGYRIDIASGSDFSMILVSDSSIADTTTVLSGFPRGQALYWRVFAKNDAGWSAPSASRVFRLHDDALFNAMPITEMGRSLYKGMSGGLYPSTLNIRPEYHHRAGLALAHAITPLDSLGRPDMEQGRIVLLSIGMSNTGQEFTAFEAMADTFQQRNPRLTLVNGAQAGQTASIIRNPDAQYWNILKNERLYRKRVTPEQVQAIWLKQANSTPSQEFPLHAERLRDDLAAIVRLLPAKFPNLKLCYVSSRIYAGYATTPLNPEPYAYESGFSVKWLIGQQIEGDSSLSFESASPQAPWMSWGPYLWSSGPNPRQDGLQWLPGDFAADGTHPSDAGRRKVATLLLDFFSTDETAVPWFLGRTSTELRTTAAPVEFRLQVSPNPARDEVRILIDNAPGEALRVELFTSTGVRAAVLHDGPHAGRISLRLATRGLGLSAGTYFLRVLGTTTIRSAPLVILP